MSFPYYCLFGQALTGDNASEQGNQVASKTEPVDSSISTIIPKATLLEKDFANLPGKIAEITASETINQQLNTARKQLGELRLKLNDLKASGLFSFDKVAEIRVSTKEHLQKVQGTEKGIAEKDHPLAANVNC
jgi:TolA-binding protein